MNEAKEFAVAFVDKHSPPLRPSALLRHSQRYKVEAWFVPNLKRLLIQPYSSFTKKEDYDTLQPDLLPNILDIKSRMEEKHRELLTQEYNDFIHVCHPDDKDECHVIFNNTLRDVVARLFHPTSPITPALAEHMLNQTMRSYPEGHCYKLAVYRIKEAGYMHKSKACMREGMLFLAESFGIPSNIVPEELDTVI